MIKAQKVILRTAAEKLKWREAAEIIGLADRNAALGRGAERTRLQGVMDLPQEEARIGMGGFRTGYGIEVLRIGVVLANLQNSSSNRIVPVTLHRTAPRRRHPAPQQDVVPDKQ